MQEMLPAVKNGCNILSWPLTRPMSEVEAYLDRLQTSLDENPNLPRPLFAAMRQLSQFENLFKNAGGAENGFPAVVDLGTPENRAEYDADMLHDNLMFVTPEEVVAKLQRYDDLGVDHFTYYASLGLGLKQQKRSLELFIKEVMPEFSG